MYSRSSSRPVDPSLNPLPVGGRLAINLLPNISEAAQHKPRDKQISCKFDHLRNVLTAFLVADGVNCMSMEMFLAVFS